MRKVVSLVLVFILFLVSEVLADSPQPRILLVRDAHYSYLGLTNPNEYYGSFYDSALQALGLSYDNCTIPSASSNGPAYNQKGGCKESINGMKDYDMVIWFTGDDYGGDFPTLTETDQNETAKYLDAGGKLFIAGQNIGSDIGATDFYHNYLRAFFCTGNSNRNKTTGSIKDPIGDALNPNIDGGAGNQKSPSVVFTYTETYPNYLLASKSSPWIYGNSFYYTYYSSSYTCTDIGKTISSPGYTFIIPATVRNHTVGPLGRKVVYFAFGLEGVYGDYNRTQIMKRVYDYFAGPNVTGTKIYRRNLENTSWEEGNLTCSPSDAYCLRKLSPLINATCIENQLFANVTGGEYFINSSEPARSQYQTGFQLLASDGSFNSPVERINNTIILLSDEGEGTYTIWVHCNNTDNYYGKFDKAIFTVDKTRPIFDPNFPLKMEDGKRFTNTTKPKVEVQTLLPPYKADYMSFSCNNTAWTEWVHYSTPYYGLNLTNASIGCNPIDGNRTIYVKIRDEAGNLGSPEYVSSWIVLDTTPPKIVTIMPQNNSHLKSADSITITFYDPSCGIDGTCSNVNTSIFFNGTHYLQFSNNTPFNANWSSEGLHTLTVYINDSAGNLNITTYIFTVDNTPPNVSIETPQSGKIYSGIINILTNIHDALSDVSKVLYEIKNSTNFSQVFASGELLASEGWDVTWNSSANISETENVTLTIYANDTVGNSVSMSVNFTVDNSRSSVTIVNPRAIYLNKNFNLDIRAAVGNPATANLTNATYYIFNFSGIIVNNTTTLDIPFFNFTDSIDISTLADGNYTINASAYDSNEQSATDISWFYIDRTPPKAENFSLDVEEDTKYGNKRVYPNTPVTFYVDVSEDVAYVDKVIVTLTTPTAEQNFTLTPLTQNLKSDRWKLTFVPTVLGMYNYTRIYANDTLGNTFTDTVGISFFVVNGSFYVTLDSSNETDAGVNITLRLVFDFNKTFSSPNVLFYVPPNSPANTNQTPNYFNISSYSCNCALSYIYNSLNQTTGINATGIGNVTNITLSVNVSVGTPSSNIIDSWTATFRAVSYANSTKIKTPFLNITRIFCNDSLECSVIPANPFNLTVEVENVQTATSTGRAYNVFVWFKDSLANTTALGNMVSGNVSNVTWSGIVLNTTGNYTFTFGAWEQTKNYNATSKSFVIQVKDVDPPIISSPTWEEDNIINVNETTAYFVTVSDNVGISQVWATINQSTGYVENKTLTLYQRFVSYDIWKLEYNNTSCVGNYTILKIYANDTSNNVDDFTPEENASRFEVRELNVISSVAFESLSINNTQTIYANITGNASAIENVLVNISKPRGFYESVYLNFKNVSGTTYIFEGSYANVTRSGDYNLTINVSLSSGISKSSTTSFSVPYGNVSIEFDWPTLYLIYNTGKYNLTFYLIPDGGDLTEVNGSLFVDNTSVINLTSEQNQSFNISWEEGARVAKWEVNVSNLGSTNVTLWINSTTPSLEQNTSKTINVTIVPEDNNAPIIYSFGHEWNVTNLMEPNIIWVNANDSTVVDKVLVEISYPNGGGKENLTAVRTGRDFYELTFSNTNQTGNFSYRIFVIDIANNTNQTEPANFSVVDEFESVYVTHSPYNKGDEILFQVTVLDIRGLPVKDFNLTLILERNTTGNYTVVNGTADSGRYRVSITDPPPSNREYPVRVTYTVYATVEKNRNKGTYKGTFEVSEELPTIIEYPSDNQYFQPGSPVPIEVSVRNERGEIVNTASVTAWCQRCSWQYKKIEWDPELEKYYDPAAFIAPQEETSFSIWVFSVDLWKNMGASAVVPTTKPSAAPIQQAQAPSAGGAIAPCNCTEWKDVACGANDCTQDELYQTRVCMPAGCAEESRCIEHPACKERIDFEFTVSDSRISIEQGKDGIIVSTVKNIGTKDITVVPTVEKDCCNLSLPERFEVKPNEEVSFPISIHVPLNTSVGEYSINIKMYSSNLTKERGIVVVVEKNRLVSLVEGYGKVLDALEKEIADYKKAGVDMSDVEKLLAKVKEGLAVANNSIPADDLETLSNSMVEVESNINSINSKLLGLRIQKFLYENKWNILVGSILTFFSVYVSIEIVIPFYKLTKEIKELEFEKNSLINSRIETEKQFFLRKIDERTFRSIISEKQGQLYKITASLNLKKEERRKLLTRLSPVYFYRWLKEGVKKLRKK